MSMIYVWKSENIEPEAAEARFKSIIGQQVAMYSSSYGRNYTWSSKRIGSIFIAQIDLIKGVKGWEPWVERFPVGVAWSGVCEKFLGTSWSSESLQFLHDTALHKPEELATWSGTFAFVTWDSNTQTVTINAGATQSQPLWYTSGRHGWACGSRSVVGLDLVGQEKKLDFDQARLFLLFSYHLGGGNLFKGARRLAPREQLILRRSDRPNWPSPTEYISQIDYLSSDYLSRSDGDDLYDICAERLRDRVGRQIQHSENPVLELSGGRDSRCIAAAIYRNGRSITAISGGGEKSPELNVAKDVAQELGFDLELEIRHEDILSLLLDQTGRAKSWLRLSEGLTNLGQALNDGFFNDHLPIYGSDTQFFMGHHYGMLKPEALKYNARRRLELVLQRNANPQNGVKEIVDRLIEDANRTREAALNGDVSEMGWALTFYWQNRGALWGSDVLSLMQPAAWWWTPLVDRELVQCTLLLFQRGQLEPNFMDEMTKRNAPQLSSVLGIDEIAAKKGKWDGRISRVLRRIRASRIHRVVNRNGYSLDGHYFPISNRRDQMWKDFFEKNNYVWADFCDRKYLTETIERAPDAQVLWNLATLELFVQEFV